METPNPPNPSIDFKELVDTYYTPLYRFAFSLSKNGSDASDLTQQTFLIWAKRGSTLRDITKVKSWLFTTLYREFLRVRRRASNVSYHEPEVLERELPVVETDYVQSMDAAGAVESLEEVDEVYRMPLILFYLKDLAYKEIAEILDIPIGTVMSRLSRGKAQLKNILIKKEGMRGIF